MNQQIILIFKFLPQGKANAHFFCIQILLFICLDEMILLRVRIICLWITFQTDVTEMEKLILLFHIHELLFGQVGFDGS